MKMRGITKYDKRRVGRIAAGAAVALCASVFAGSAQAAVYAVVGTEGRGLNVRAAPSLGVGLVTNLSDGTAINIVCQTRGDDVMGSTMWDKIEGPVDGYVADYYTTTPVVGNPSPGLPECPAAAPSTTTNTTTQANPTTTTTQPTTHTQTRTVCSTQTTALTNWQVYKVCLTGTSSYNGSAVSGSVAGVACSVFAPTGSALGYFCDSHVPQGRSWGSYWNARLGAREVWMNQRVNRISPYPPYSEDFSNCVYLRIDTWPNGRISSQNFARVDRDYLAHC
jgi:hypothetical protein